MKRNASITKKATFPSNGWKLTLILLLIFLSFSTIWIIRYHRSSIHATRSYLAQLKTWMNAHQPLQAGATKENKIVLNKVEAKTEIHFEFYAALPNKQLSLPISPAFTKQEKENISNNEIATNKNNQTPAISPSVNHPINLKIGHLPVVNSSFTQKLITSADELAQDVSKNIHKKAATSHIAMENQAQSHVYIIQLGVFKNELTATRYRSSLAEKGIHVNLVKILLKNKIAYRVQSTLFADKNQVRQMKLRWQKQGIVGMITAP